MKLKSKFVLMVTIWDILITWTITRILDYFLKMLGARFDFKEFKQAFYGVWLMVFRGLIDVYCEMYFSDEGFIERTARLEPAGGMFILTTLLQMHRSLHRRGSLDTSTCRSCRTITRNKEILLKFIPDPKLYPPFSFSKE